MGKENEETQLLSKDTFWDENVDFFGIKPETPGNTNVETVVESVKNDTVKSKTTKEKETENPESEEEQKQSNEEVTFFGDSIKENKKKETEEEKGKENQETNATDTPEEKFENDTPEGNDEQPFESEESEQKFFKTLATGLKEGGIFSNVEIKDDDVIDGDKFADLIDSEAESRVNETFEAFFEELDEDGAAFLRFKKAGGKTSDFLRAYANSAELPTSDLTTSEGQKEILKYYYKHIDGTDDEDIDDKIEWAVENGKLEKYAEKYSKIIQDRDKQKRDTLLLQQEEQQRQLDEERKKFESELKITLENTDAINNITLTKEDKKELIPFMTKPSVKIGKNKYITGLQAGIQKIFSDKPKLLLLAKLVKSDFDLTGVEKKGASKLTKEVKTELQRQKQTPGPKSTDNTTRELADFFK
jgi:hypothetical protein